MCLYSFVVVIFLDRGGDDYSEEKQIPPVAMYALFLFPVECLAAEQKGGGGGYAGRDRVLYCPTYTLHWKTGRGKASGRGIEIRRRGKPEPTWAEEEEEEEGGGYLSPLSKQSFVFRADEGNSPMIT